MDVRPYKRTLPRGTASSGMEVLQGGRRGACEEAIPPQPMVSAGCAGLDDGAQAGDGVVELDRDGIERGEWVEEGSGERRLVYCVL